jgi:hypothetical protein
MVTVALEDVHTRRTSQTNALVDSRCMRTCIDIEFAREARFMLTRIPKPIKVEYADRTVVDGSTIWYSTNIRIRAAGVTVVMGTLVTRLKSTKVFLGFDWLQAVNPRIDWKEQKIETEDGVVPLQMWIIAEEPPDYTTIYKEVFSEEAFQELLPRQKWDHQINLVPGHTPLRGRCYLLVAWERQALKEFIATNMDGGKIKKSDLP